MRWLPLLVLLLTGCAARSAGTTAHAPARHAGVSPGVELIGDLKDFAESLGSHATDNFRARSEQHAADNRCYFTGRLQLPAFYSALHMVREDGDRCAARSREHDVFFYPVQAVASGQETITVSLAEAPTERVLVVVPHEDFHSQREARKAPTEVAEAAATLVGFLTASDFARQRFGDDAPTTKMLARETELFLRKSLIVNQYYERVDELYRSIDAGRVTAQQGLAQKAGLFADLQRACSDITPEPVSFNKCPAVLNNAGLAFDRTYTRHYPMLYDLYRLLGNDTTMLVGRLRRLMDNWPVSAARAVDLIGRE